MQLWKLNARKPRRRKADTDEDWAARIALWEDERDHAAHELLPYTAARLSAVTGDDGASAEQIEAVNKRTNKALEELG